MSVNYSASIVRGWKIDQNMYNIALNTEGYEDYLIRVDEYEDNDYGLFFGARFEEACVGDYECLDGNPSDKEIEDIMTAYMDVYHREPTYPRTFLLCEVH